MTIKRMSAGIIALLLLFMLTACGASEETAFAYDITGEPSNLDPQLASDSASLLVLQNTMEGLMSYDKDGALTMGAALSYTVSDDGMTYVFTLDETANWVHRGSVYAPVTAHDFVFAFQRIFDTATASPFIKEFMCIKNADEVVVGQRPKEALGVYASKTYELTVELSYPFDGFLALTATTPAMPCNPNLFTETQGKYGTNIKNMAFNGPFILSSWKSGESLTLRKNTSYHRASEVLPSRVVLYPPMKDQDSTARFLAGTTDVMSVSGDRIEALVADGYGYEQFQDTTWALVFNTNDAVFANKNIRLAFAHSFTNTSYLHQFPIWLKKAGAFVPPVVSSGMQPYRRHAGLDFMLEYQPDAARGLLNAGLLELEQSKLPKVTVLCPQQEVFGFLMQYVQQTWQDDLSAFVSLERKSDPDILRAVKNGQFQVALVPFRPESDNVSEMLSQFVSDSPKNITGYQNPDYDALMTAATLAATQQEATGDLIAAEQLLIEQGVLIPFAYQTSFYAISKNANDIVISPFGGGLFFKYATIAAK